MTGMDARFVARAARFGTGLRLRIFALIRSAGFREAEVYKTHGRLDDAGWDVVIVELLIPSNPRRE